MKKRLTAVAAATMVLGGTLLAGCGSGDKSDDKSITLAVWGSSPAEITALDNTIDSFTKETGIKVEKEVIQDKYMDVMKARFSAKNAPDVFYVDSFELPALAESGVLLDQSETLKDQDDFYKPLLDAFKGSDGKIYGAPKDYSTLALYVNTEMLEKAGFKTSDIPETMDEFFEFTKKVQAKLPDGQAAMLLEKDLSRNLDAFDALGADVVTGEGKANFSSDKKVEQYLEKVVENKKAGVFAFPKDDLGSDSAIAAFGSGKAVMMIDGNWSLGAFAQDFPDLKFSTHELPTINGKNHTMTFTVGYAVNKQTENKDNAIEFVNYMTNEGQEQWAKGSGTLPTRASVAEKMDLTNDKYKASHVAGAEYATVWSRGTTLPIINTSFGNHFQAVMNGQAKLADALKAIDKEANDEIARQQ